MQKEFVLDEKTKAELGEIKVIEAISPKSWLKYGIHIVQPVLGMLPERGKLQGVENTGAGRTQSCHGKMGKCGRSI